MRVHVYRNRPNDLRPRSELTFCETCGGWYGVPHTGSHCQQGVPNVPSGEQGCACRSCREATGQPIEGRYGFFSNAKGWQP